MAARASRHLRVAGPDEGGDLVPRARRAAQEELGHASSPFFASRGREQRQQVGLGHVAHVDDAAGDDGLVEASDRINRPLTKATGSAAWVWARSGPATKDGCSVTMRKAGARSSAQATVARWASTLEAWYLSAWPSMPAGKAMSGATTMEGLEYSVYKVLVIQGELTGELPCLPCLSPGGPGCVRRPGESGPGPTTPR